MPPRERQYEVAKDAPSKLNAPLIEATQHLLKPNGSIVGREVAKEILPRFPTFASAIPTELPSRPALASIDGRSAMTHSRIFNFVVHEFGPELYKLGFGQGDRIALVLPNGPELALAIVATAHWASCVPLSATGAQSELEADLERCGAHLVIGPYSGPLAPGKPPRENSPFHVPSSSGRDWTVFGSVEESARRLNIPFVGLVPSPNEAGAFRLVPTKSVMPLAYDAPIELRPLRDDSSKAIDFLPSAADDEVLVLFTSGTTGNKKLVPHQMRDMLTAAATICLSWALDPSDVNCNLMPLFHVGGIVRQVFSPLFSGGCVICCPSFDPSVFWTLLSKRTFTWYYAAPTMHQLILQTGRQPADGNDGMTLEEQVQPRLRMIANAAGGLLPSLAVQLRKTFGAYVLPSYGMTECMPISSPPSTYELEKPGTSGVPVGPEVAILNLATMESVAPGVEGPICVRGEPCFRGYGAIANDPSQKAVATFLKEGWFNTGDLGYLDEDGYLYITGRSKEVINRGGEIISPMEVEEAVLSHPDVSTCAAFSAPHDVLQEVVGMVLVMVKGRPRLDIPSLHEYLGDKLAAPKWPQCLVFMDGLPKSHTNKLLRVKLGSRLQIPELSDEMYPVQRTFEATCPPQGTPLEVSIPCKRVHVSQAAVQEVLASRLVESDDQQLLVAPHPSRAESLVCYLFNIDRMVAIDVARSSLDRYAVPSHFVMLEQRASNQGMLAGPQPTDAVSSILQGTQSTGPLDPVVKDIQKLFIDLLQLDYVPGPDANFFHLGGSSLVASQLASKIRKMFAVPCSGAEVFHHSTCEELGQLVRRRSDDNTLVTASDDSSDTKAVDSQGAPFPASRLASRSTFLGSLFQLVPLFVVIPFWQVTRYLLFFALILRSLDVAPGARDIGTFIIGYLMFHICWLTITPLVFVAIKWLVIGRYRAGRYPIWGSYYLRWWIVDICRKLFLRGAYGSNHAMLRFYYRLLGAKIGKGARINIEAEIAEFDLVTIGEDAAIEYGTVRGFGVDTGSSMILGPVSVGKKASVGTKSVVAPYTSVPDGGHLGPNTGSYEIGKALDEKNMRMNQNILPEPHLLMQLLVGRPIEFLVNSFGQIPPLVVLLCMLHYKGEGGEFTTTSDLMAWLCHPGRIPYYIGIRVARAIVTPFFYMAAALVVKKCVIGKFTPGPRDTTSQWQLMRQWLSASLFTRKKIQAVADLIGRHYELVSCLYRALGCKVGKRVFWSGRVPVIRGDFDLLEIGDDVVFGSRSYIFCTTVDSFERVVLCAGSNVADNCVVCPGGILGKNAVLGSNSVCPQGWYLPQGSVWLGTKEGAPECLEKGTEVGLVDDHLESASIGIDRLDMRGDASTIRPFGKAVYQGKANYFVWPLWLIIVWSFAIRVGIAIFHTLPLLGALHGAAAVLYGFWMADRDYYAYHYPFSTVYFTVFFMFVWTHMIRVFVWLGLELTAKWTLMGKRKEGRYNYDTCDYAQRWELYQLLSKLRKFGRLNFLQFVSGTPFMNLFFRLNGGTIGKDCCLYPSGADPFMPEPDLVEIGDRCVIDCASIVCHLNTRGNFELAKIVVENDCTLRTRSRIQQGVYMEEGSMVLEKSLVLTGEVVEANSVWQGAPASLWFQYNHAERFNGGGVLYANGDVEDDSGGDDESSGLLKGSNKKIPSYA